MGDADRGHLLQIHGLDDAVLGEILSNTVRRLRTPSSAVDGGHRGLVGLLFFENSTRTRLSFAAAAYALGAGVLDLNAAVSSVNKGESFIDTAYTLEAMGARAMVVRSREAGVPHQIARALARIGSGSVVLNAGDGRHEHPTQAIIDAVTLGERLGRLKTSEQGGGPSPRDAVDLSGVRVAIVGDLLNSRVARSGSLLLRRLGAEVVGCGPESMAPDAFGRALGLKLERDLDALAGRVDAAVMLRVQFERHADAPARTEGLGVGLDRGVYRGAYAMTPERLARFDEALGRPTAILHPGPMNRGLEIEAAVADGPNALIRRQVAVGVAVRAALLARALR